MGERSTKVKVIIHDGVVMEVLADGPVDVEIVDVDVDYEDYNELSDYEQELYKDKSLKPSDFTVAHFGED